jgi:hypothetical protein
MAESDAEGRALLKALLLRFHDRTVLASRALGLKDSTVSVWKNRGYVSSKPAAREAVRKLVTGHNNAASSMHQVIEISLSDMGAEMAKDPSLRKALHQLESLYLAKDGSPKLWKDLCEYLEDAYDVLRKFQSLTKRKQERQTAAEDGKQRAAKPSRRRSRDVL